MDNSMDNELDALEASLHRLYDRIDDVEDVAEKTKYRAAIGAAVTVLYGVEDRSDNDELTAVRNDVDRLIDEYDEGQYSGGELLDHFERLYEEELGGNLYFDPGRTPDGPGGGPGDEPDEPDRPDEPGEDPEPDDPDEPDGRPGSDGPTDGYGIDIGLDVDEPAEYRYNDVGGPLGLLAKRQMKKRNYRPVPHYDVVFRGEDARQVVEERVSEIEIETLLGDEHERRVERAPVDPDDFYFTDDAEGLQVRDPVPLEQMVSDYSLWSGRSWPDGTKLRVRALDHEGNYLPRQQDT